VKHRVCSCARSMRVLCAACGTQRAVLVSSLVRAMEFVTLRAGGCEGSAVFFATEQLLCVPVTTAHHLGLEIRSHEPAGPTGPQRLEFLDSSSECPSFLGDVHLFVPIVFLSLLS
ncbi:unnamed protein product, partial [Cladocopium goreaui]